MAGDQCLRIGTRQSALAIAQSSWVASELQLRHIDVELVKLTTSGDEHVRSPKSPVGTGVYTREIQQALLDGAIDLAVHSLKDLPTEIVPGLSLAAVPRRATVEDILITLQESTLDQLPSGSRIGTSSLRRSAQILHLRRDVRVEPIRGNVDTRLRKLDQGDYDAIVLARAGLERLGLLERIHCLFPTDQLLPAPGQGALGLEIRKDDDATAELLSILDHVPTRHCVTAERSMLSELHGGCRAPVAGWAHAVSATELELAGAVISIDGQRKLVASSVDLATSSVELGRSVAALLADQGAHGLIEESRGLI